MLGATCRYVTARYSEFPQTDKTKSAAQKSKRAGGEGRREGKGKGHRSRQQWRQPKESEKQLLGRFT